MTGQLLYTCNTNKHRCVNKKGKCRHMQLHNVEVTPINSIAMQETCELIPVNV